MSHRTMARAQQLEVEERAKLQRPGSRNGDYSDNLDQAATATLLRDDQIDFHYDDEDQERGQQYQDEFMDDEDDVFTFGDGDDEEAIGLDRQPPQR